MRRQTFVMARLLDWPHESPGYHSFRRSGGFGIAASPGSASRTGANSRPSTGGRPEFCRLANGARRIPGNSETATGRRAGVCGYRNRQRSAGHGIHAVVGLRREDGWISFLIVAGSREMDCGGGGCVSGDFLHGVLCLLESRPDRQAGGDVRFDPCGRWRSRYCRRQDREDVSLWCDGGRAFRIHVLHPTSKRVALQLAPLPPQMQHGRSGQGR